MTKTPPRWSGEQLTYDAAISIGQFRGERLQASDAWTTHYLSARAKFDALFQALDDLRSASATDDGLTEVFRRDLGEALRYLAGPPISEDDLQVIAGVKSLSPGVLGKDPEASRRIFDVIRRVIDTHRFPWVTAGGAPSTRQRDAALLASAVLLATQRVATERRNTAKERQEAKTKDYLRKLGFTEAAPTPIDTLVNGPQAGQFCGECRLGHRKADVVVRLHDTRLMPIECKVSNSATNSVKRINNDAAVKAEYWIDQFGALQVVPAAVLSGVFNVVNLEQAQQRNLALFWSHALDKLGAFVESTRRA